MGTSRLRYLFFAELDPTVTRWELDDVFPHCGDAASKKWAEFWATSAHVSGPELSMVTGWHPQWAS